MNDKKYRHNIYKILISVIVFIGFFLFFFLRNHYYIPGTLEIKGDFKSRQEAVLSWDSGNGFNQNEVLPIIFEEKTTNKTIELPQLGIKELKITNTESNKNLNIDSLVIRSENGEQNLSFDRQSNPLLAKVATHQLEKTRPLLILIQIFLSLLLAWLTYEILSLKKKFQKKNWLLTFKYIFFEEKHWTFWVMALISSAVFSFWLLGQWPGAASPDTFYQLYQTKILVFNNAHPYLHTIYMLILMQFYDSFATIAIFQLLVTSLLLSYIFYFSIKNGLKFYLILPFFFAFVLSIPIGLFNIIVWKDVPFSLLVFFFGFFLFYLGYEKNKGTPVEFNFKKIVILAFLFILMVLMRHNGFVFLFVLPLILFVAKLMTKGTLAKFVLVSAIFFLIFKLLLPGIIGVKNYTSDFSSLVWKVNPLVNLVYSRSYISNNSKADQEIVEKIVGVDNIQKHFYSPSSWDVAAYTSLTNLQEEDVKKFNQLFYKSILLNLPIFLSERTEKFFTLLSPRVNVWANDYLNPDYLKSYIYQWRSGTAFYIQFSPVEEFKDIQVKSLNFLSGFRPIVFDLLYPTLVLLIILLFYKWLPISAFSSLFFLSQIPFWFIMTISPEFRYLYFIYLYYFVVFPLLILEVNLSRQKVKKSVIKSSKTYNFFFLAIYLIFLLPYLTGGVIIYKYRSEINSYKVSPLTLQNDNEKNKN